jgi:GDSL-like lipase/acylhydrolase family protein
MTTARLRASTSLAVTLTVLAVTAPALGRGAGGDSSPSGTPYYVALGDSLSTGGGASAGHGYVKRIFAWAQASVPGLQLEDLGCGGDSTTRMIEGGLCHNYTTGDQLGDAEAFLSAHPGEVKFVTIDVGGDDIVGCALSGTINPACVQRALEHVVANMPIILEGLRTAGGAKLPIVGMTYYDPILAFYLTGSAGEQTARESVAILKSLNRDLLKAYRRFHVKVANVEKAFASTDWRATGSYEGRTLPQNVANVCNWTHMCEAEPNIHTNDHGHEIIAARYERLLKRALR